MKLCGVLGCQRETTGRRVAFAYRPPSDLMLGLELVEADVEVCDEHHAAIVGTIDRVSIGG